MTRTMWLTSVVALTALTGLSTAGCYVESGPPPNQPVYQPAPPVAQSEVVYDTEPPAPPPPEPEVQPAPPAPDYVWIGGYHHWEGHGYAWRRGHYERRPHPNAQWQGAHWEARGRGRVWVEGHWR